MTCIRSVDASRNVASRRAEVGTSTRRRSSGFWVAMPDGQLFELQMRAAIHPIA